MLELTPGIARYNFPTPIDFGVGARQKIVDELKARSLSRPLIVTDQFLSKLVPVTGINQMLEDIDNNRNEMRRFRTNLWVLGVVYGF